MSLPIPQLSGLFALTIAWMAVPAFGVESTKATGKIASVTIYQDEARVMREIDIPASKQPQTILVDNLPVKLVAGSLYTESDSAIVVQGLRVRIAEDNSETDGDEKTKKLNKDLALAKHDLLVIEQDLQTLERLITFSADGFEKDLSTAKVDVKSVTDLAKFSMEKRRELAAELFEKQTEIDEIQQAVSESEYEDATKDNDGFQALITVRSPTGGTLRLSYSVGGVYWQPHYRVNGSTKSKDLSVVLGATIFQDCGEPWNNIELSLATSARQSEAAGPVLTPLRVHVDEAQSQGSSKRQTSSPANSYREDYQYRDPEFIARSLRLNGKAARRQIDELTSSAEVQRRIADDAGQAVTDEVYVIDTPVSLASHGDPQGVVIFSSTMQGEIYRVVTPLLSSFAHREASAINESGHDLIAGPADVYLDDDFVGQIRLPPTANGQTVRLGFGADRQLRTRRELLSRTDSIKGGNRISNLVYRLVVSNFHDTPIEIRLQDRLPIAAKDDSINVSLSDQDTGRLSTDKLYQRLQRPTGILRWDLEIPAKAFGSDAYDHEYAFSIELDRNKKISNNDLTQSTGKDLRFQESNMDAFGGGMGGFGGGGGGGQGGGGGGMGGGVF